VADLSRVRRDLREKDITYRVVKNRLARIAAEQAGRPELVGLLTGPSALAVGGSDETALAKGLLDATRAFKVEIRGAAMNGQQVDGATVVALASLPPREVLLAQLAGAMALRSAPWPASWPRRCGTSATAWPSFATSARQLAPRRQPAVPRSNQTYGRNDTTWQPDFPRATSSRPSTA
jgi:hypothetical protein